MPTQHDPYRFLQLRFMSSARALKLSKGEVKKPDTISLKSRKPVPDGLFCQKIFGPVEDYKCICGMYAGKNDVGIICKRCGVEIIPRINRARRLGHIKLEVPVLNPLAYNLTSKILNVPIKKLQNCLTKNEELSIIYYNSLKKKEVTKIVNSSYSLYSLVLSIDIKDLIERVEGELKTILNKYMKSDVALKDLFIDVLLVNPPNYRPSLELDKGGITVHDFNYFYSGIIRNNNRIKVMKARRRKIPMLITEAEAAVLQRKVEGLFIGKHKDIKGKEYTSLLASLSSKEGLLRNSLLGKRTDYSGRSAIVPNPNLQLDQAEIPEKILLEILKPFIISKLIKDGHCKRFKDARKLHKQKDGIVLKVLADIAPEHQVILNRQPTLHRFGVMSFTPMPTNKKAIGLHPLVCAPYNADFDGDTMGVHVPLFKNAREECKVMLTPNNNLLSSLDSRLLLTPSHEMIIGCHYMTKLVNKDTNFIISSFKELEYLHNSGVVAVNEKVSYKNKGQWQDTCYGRLLIEDMFKCTITEALNKKEINVILSQAFDRLEKDKMIESLNLFKTLTFEYATQSGLSLGIDDFRPNKNKQKILDKDIIIEERLQAELDDGKIDKDTFISELSRERLAIIDELLKTTLSDMGEDNPIVIMWKTGARVSGTQVNQIVGCKGLTMDKQGKVLPYLMRDSLAEGLDTHEWFISTKGVKTSAFDKLSATPSSGYLARKLVTAARDFYIVEEDCGSAIGVTLKKNLAIGRVEAGANNLVDNNDKREHIIVRSPVTCKARNGICASCYGIDPSTREMVKQKTPVGVIAAQTLSEPATQLCLAGDTEIFNVNGENIKIKDIKKHLTSNVDEDFMACTSSPLGQQEVTRVIDCFANRKEKTKARVTLERKGDVDFFECTTDHPVMLSDGKYKRAKDLVPGERVMSMFTRFPPDVVVKDVGIVEMEKEELFYDITVESKYHNFALGAGCFVHNSMRTFHTSGAAELGESSPLEIRSSESSAIKIDKGSGDWVRVQLLDKDDCWYLAKKDQCEILIKDKSDVDKNQVLIRYLEKDLMGDSIRGKLPQLESLFETRKPKTNVATIALETGKVKLELDDKANLISILVNDKECGIVTGDKPIYVYNGQQVQKGAKLSYGDISLPGIYLHSQDLELISIVFIDSVLEIYGMDIKTVHLEMILRSMTELGLDEQGVLRLRRLYPNIDVLLKGVSRAALDNPSWLKQIGFGWTHKALVKAANNMATTLDLPSEKILRGALIK